MAVGTQPTNRYLERPAPSSLADVVDTILDKGLVIDVYVRVSLVGIELITIDARIVVASVDTYLRFASAVNRLDLTETQTSGLPELMEDITESGAKSKASGAIQGAKEKVTDLLPGGGGREEEKKPQKSEGPRRRRGKEASGESEEE